MFLLFLLLCNGITSAKEASSLNHNTISLSQLLNNTDILNSIKNIDRKNKEILKAQQIAYVNKQITEEYIGIPDGEELLLSLYIDDYYIADLFAYKSKKNAQISLNNLFELLDFPIIVDVTNKRASGWFINETNRFNLELPTLPETDAVVTINEQKTSLNYENYYIESDELYVDADIIADWFAVAMAFNFTDLEVTVTSETPLPIQQKLAREKRKLQQNSDNEATLPWKPSNYQTISTPLIDIQLYTSINKEKQTNYNYSILGQNDFAYLSSEYYVNGGKADGLSNVRLSFNKESEEAGLLGPFNATQYEFGDITPVQTFAGSTGGISRGFKFSNKDIKQNNNNRNMTFSGNIQPGWDIELYRNNILIGRQLSSTEGRYDFKDVPLLFGNNTFDLIFYGPQGQVKKETQEVYVDSTAMGATESYYEFSTVQQNKQLFNVSDIENTEPTGWLSTLNYRHGISDLLSLNGSLEYLLDDEGDNEQRYALGADFTLLERFLFNADFSINEKSHTATSLGSRTQFAGHSFNLTYDRVTGDNDTLSQEIYFDMVGKLFSTSFPVDYQNSLKNSRKTDEYGFKTTDNYFNNQIVLPFKHAKISNYLSYYMPSLTEDYASGSARLQTAFGPMFSRFSAGYDIYPESKFHNYQVNLSMPITGSLQSDLDFNYDIESKRYNSLLSFYWQNKFLNLNSTLNYDSDGNWTVGLNTRFSFSYEPTSGQFLLSNNSFAKSGSLLVRVFEDDNLNGQYDEGERLVEGVKTKALQSHRTEHTNEDGVAVFQSLSKGKRTDIVIDQATLDEPFIIPATPGVSITPRKGFMEIIDIPLVNAGELEGTVYITDRDGNESVGAYLTILLNNQDGKLIATTETEFDGYYLFTDLVPGKYTVSVDTADIKRKNLRDTQVLNFDFSAAGDVIAGADFLLDKYTLVDGYVVELGEFHSLLTLKAYWMLIKTRYNDALRQQVFYMEDATQQKYQLNAAFFKDEKQAKRACEYMAEKTINCSVKKFEFNL